MRLHMKIQTIPWDGGARIPIPVCHHGSEKATVLALFVVGVRWEHATTSPHR